MTSVEIRAALTGEQALTCTLLGEARGEPLEGIVAVASVIRNRAENPRWWGSSIRTVCLKRLQFSCWWEEGSANTRAVHDLATALMTGQPLGDRSLVSELRWIAQGVIGEQLRDASDGADHYLTTALFRSAQAPKWAKGKTPVAIVGGHTFLRLEI